MFPTHTPRDTKALRLGTTFLQCPLTLCIINIACTAYEKAWYTRMNLRFLNKIVLWRSPRIFPPPLSVWGHKLKPLKKTAEPVTKSASSAKPGSVAGRPGVGHHSLGTLAQRWTQKRHCAEQPVKGQRP